MSVDISAKAELNVFPEYTVPDPSQVTRDHRTIAEKFEIPPEGLTLIDFFFTKEDQAFILSRKEEVFPAETMDAAYREDAFSRGIISKKDETGQYYRLNTFYGLLDFFCVSRTETYHTLPRETRRELDRWYYKAYMDSLDQDLTHRPTSDRVLTMQEMLDFLDQDDRVPYLNYCDCRSLGGDCGMPTHTCINLEPGTNGFVSRGISERLTKEEAKEVIRKADAAGLVHTLSDHGICNCCNDCCYLFRGQKTRGSIGFWPASRHIIEMDREKCIRCGKCAQRCPFGVFTREGRGKEAVIHMDRTTCVGCGLCANTCPTKALKITDRTPDQIQIAGRFGDGHSGRREKEGTV